MKKITILLLLILAVTTINAQKDFSFNGATNKIPNEQLIKPYGVEVTFDKTVHIIFPSKVIYVDLGSNNIIAGKADGTENVIRLKAATEDFESETNLSVICDDGSFYPFNARYAAEPIMLNIDMRNMTVPTANTPSTALLTELGNEPPKDVNWTMQYIYNADKKLVRHIGDKQQKIHFSMKGIYVRNGIFYFHTLIKNQSHVSYDVEYIKFKIVDKQIAGRTPVQEKELPPVRIYNKVSQIKGKSTSRVIYALPKFTLPQDKILVVVLIEKDGGRHLSIQIESSDIANAKTIDKFKTK